MATARVGDYRDDIEDVNLDAMTIEELIAEHVAVKDEVRSIQAQLMDKDRRPPAPEDDSSEWDDYRDWRRRARWALVYRQRESGEIKTLLVERQREREEENQRRKADAVMTDPESVCHTAEEYRALAASAVERRAALMTTLNQGDAPETLVLRLYRAMRHLLTDGEGFPPELDEDDTDAMRLAAIFLRSRFTSGGVRQFVDSRLSDYSSPVGILP